MSASAARTAIRAVLELWLNCVVWFVVFISILLKLLLLEVVRFSGKLALNLLGANPHSSKSPAVTVPGKFNPHEDEVLTVLLLPGPAWYRTAGRCRSPRPRYPGAPSRLAAPP